MTAKRTQSATTTQVNRHPDANAKGLTANDISAWLTLQSLTLAQPGICTDTALFYRPTRDVFVSARNTRIVIEPGAAIRFSTAFNVLGLEALNTACRLGRLAFALRGVGEVEVVVCQGLSGRSWQRQVVDIVTLCPTEDTVIDLETGALNRREGAIWIELRALGSEGVEVEQGRFVTDAVPDPNLRLAICRPAPDFSDDTTVDPTLNRILNWATAQNGCAAVLTCGMTAPGLITLPPAYDRQAAYAAMLVHAKAQGFTHALMIDPDSTVDPETLDRTLACLSILRDPTQALGATALHVTEAWQTADNGLTRNPEGKLSALSSRADLREIANVLDVGAEAVADTAGGMIVPQSRFLAFSLTALRDAPTLTSDRIGVESVSCLNVDQLHVNQIPGLIIRRDTFGRKVTGLMTLQNLIFPEQGICTESNMFFHGLGAVAYDELSAAITIETTATAYFDTYFNALSIGKWHENCTLNDLWLGLNGRGKVEVKVFHAIADRSWEVLATTILTLSKGNEALIDLSHYPENATRGLIFFEVRALSTGVAITGARYMTEGAPNPARRLALSITTFKREAQVENTARRLAHYFERAEFADQMDCFIVDNGNSAHILAHPKIHHVPNANLGGAGGFTRGLLEAEAAGYSHVLFMDDDASIPMEALHRTYAYLTLAIDPKAAVAGAMINNTDKWRMWENGATFDRKCHPLFTGTDLRDRDAVFKMENESARSRSTKMYGGWWFFAFPVAAVTHHPFPFFVRGDDVNFSLVNEFAITTLNGVVSFADDFIDKESPLTWYLDLRSHMVHHLTLDKMEVGRFELAKIGLSFIKRNLVKFQYETADAVLLAWQDVLKGPDFFTGNADASGARAAIKALTKNEVWHPVADLDLVPKGGLLANRNTLRRWFYQPSLNGHFLPLFSLWGSKKVIPAFLRGDPMAVWGAYQLTFLNSTRDKGYVTKRSNWRAAKLMGRVAAIWLRTLFAYDDLRKLYHRRYPEITTPSYWRGALTMKPVASVVKSEKTEAS